MPFVPLSVEASTATFASLAAELPGLAPRLAGLAVPTVFVHGASSPMPVTASTDTAAAIGTAARVVVVDGAGHFVWHERPGAVRAALDALTRPGGG
jgi:pimeloyl-ACP methyl ester carboxylesterase